MKKLLMTAVAALSLGVGAASAATFTLSAGPQGMTAGTIPGGNPQLGSPNNDVLDQLFGAPASLGGWFGATVGIDPAATKIRVEVFGWEATLDNTLTIEGVTVGNAPDGMANTNAAGTRTVLAPDVNTPLQAVTVGVTGALDFIFQSFNPTPALFSSAANGSNPDGSPAGAGVNTANFFASFGVGNEAATEGNSLWLFFDDTGQSGDNHDDLAIRISAVPLPAGALLLLSGLGALALGRRKS